MSDNSNLITSKALVNDEWKFLRKVTRSYPDQFREDSPDIKGTQRHALLCFASVFHINALFLTISEECQLDSNRRKPLADTSSSASIWDPLR